MANVLVEETSLSNIASAIRGKNGSTSVYKPGEMAAAITNLPTGGSSGGSGNEDGLLAGTIVNYENTTATKIKAKCFLESATLVTATFTNVSNVGAYAFSNCPELTQVSLPKATTIAGTECFSRCSKLSNVNLSNVTNAGDTTFSLCESLTSINLPRVENLNKAVFYNCSNLAKADLRSCKEFSGYGQFNNCSKLTVLILRSNTICSMPYQNTLQGSAIASSGPRKGYVYVPRALVNEYKNATNWTVYADRIRAIEDYPDITGG